ncbi:MAG: Maf family protein [Thermoguttaceae bacterium]|nr:Maf family protein [Thermoguttaceae bacterium]MDW8078831.1 Maf family protein [Thermoguttaceae bacterium]
MNPGNDSQKFPKKLILASRSPRRKQLLTEAGYEFEVHPSGIEEQPARPGESAAAYAMRLAYEKAASVVSGGIGGLVLGCDTVVECDGQIFGTPVDERDAERILKALRGKRHRVVTGVCLWDTEVGRAQIQAATTTVEMDHLSDAEITEYLNSGQWRGKAGAFGYQDRLGWVRIVEGSESNVVGLPLELLAEMLRFFFLEKTEGASLSQTGQVTEK